MKLQHIALAIVAAASITQAQAVTFTGSNAPVGVVTDYSAGSLVSFDLDLSAESSFTLNFTVDAADVANGSLSFNALVRNLSGLGFDKANVALSGISFAGPAGTFGTDGFATVSSSGSNLTQAWAQFNPSVYTEFYVGNPLSQVGRTDWTLNTQGLQAGNQFSVTVAVPEPETYALMLAGLAVAAVALRRRA